MPPSISETLSGTTVLVTGASGFLGAHVVKACLKRGLKVSVGIRAGSNAWRLRETTSRINRLDLDLTKTDTIKESIRLTRPEVIIHCAAYGVDFQDQDPFLAFQTNVTGVYHLMAEAAAFSVSRFIHLGSCFEYGDKDHPVHEDEVLKPFGIYGATKACGSLLALQLGRQLGLPTIVLRPFGLYGPLEASHRFVPSIISACLSKQPVSLTSGDQIRDYTYVEDLADMTADLAHGNTFPSYEILNLGSGQPLRLKELGEKIRKMIGCDGVLLWGSRQHRPGEMDMLVADISKAKKLLGWSPRTDLTNGINETIRYLKRH